MSEHVTTEDLSAGIDKLGETALSLIGHLQEQRDEYREILHDILFCEEALEHAPAHWVVRCREAKAAAWARAWEKFEP